LIATDHQRTGTKILEDHDSKQIPDLLTKDPPKTTSKAEFRTVAEGKAEAHTHQDLYTTCTTAMKPTITPKIAPIYIDTEKKMDQELAQPSQQLVVREVNNIM
jgi:hypothetical protein